MTAQIDRAYRRTGLGRTIIRLVSYGLYEGRPLTTRGRWINPLVFFLLAIQRQIPCKPLTKPIFVVGAGRSGTTITGVLLSVHPQVGFLNEPRAIWHRIFKGEDVSGNWTSRHADFRLAAHHADLSTCAVAHRLFGNYLRAVRRTRLVDKTPEGVFRIPFISQIFPDARFLVVVRNGFAVADSIARWSEKFRVDTGGQRHDWWGRDLRKWRLLVEQLVREETDLSHLYPRALAWTDQRQMGALEWLVTARESLRHAERNDKNVLLQPYEALLEDPAEALERIQRFCELEPDNTLMQYGQSVLRPATHHDRFELDEGLREPFLETLEKVESLRSG